MSENAARVALQGTGGNVLEEEGGLMGVRAASGSSILTHQDRAGVTSVWEKSSPLNSIGSLFTFASA